MQKRLKFGDQVGRWRIDKHIGSGGNGDVYRVTCGEIQGALKRLKIGGRRTDAQARFREEIHAMRHCQDIPGVLRLLDSQVDPRNENPGFDWFVAELATPLDEKLQGASLDDIVGAIAEIASTLAKMHARQYTHRDIKPGNLFWTENGWKVGDFGLIDYPDKNPLTEEGQKLGPLHYLAPEMLLDGASAIGAPADVYSLAKVLWAMAAGQHYPIPGQLDRSFLRTRLSSWVGGTRAIKLEPILHAATHPEPLERPTMHQLHLELVAVSRAPVSTMLDSVEIPSTLARELSDRSGHRERLEQSQARMEDQNVERRILQWMRARFAAVVQELQDKITTIEGIQVHRGLNRASGALSPIAEHWTSARGGVPPSVFEDCVVGSIRRTSGGYLDLAFGVRAEFETKEVRFTDGGALIPLYTRPVVVSVAYLYGDSGRREMTRIWSSEHTFLMDGAEDETACARLLSEFRSHFVEALHSLVQQANKI